LPALYKVRVEGEERVELEGGVDVGKVLVLERRGRGRRSGGNKKTLALGGEAEQSITQLLVGKLRRLMQHTQAHRLDIQRK
jgi:hypothetical protein